MSRAPIPVGPFDLIQPIGRGGMGEIWGGRHRAQGLEVAAKVITAPTDDPSYRSRFLQEVQAVARLDHPGILTVYDYGRISAEAEFASAGALSEGSPVLIMELARHGPLGRTGVASWGTLRSVVHQILDALSHAHARGVVHRDLKPANVLVTSRSADHPEAASAVRVKLADFGLAHAMHTGPRGAAPLGAHQIEGTPAYMAPEQLMGRWRDYGPWTDLYGLGCLVYKLASGCSPFAAESHEAVRRGHLDESPPPLDPLFEVPRGLLGWLRRLLAKHPGNRFQRAADAAAALERCGAAASRSPALRGAPLPEPDELATMTSDLGAPCLELPSREPRAQPASWPPLPPLWERPIPSPGPPALVDAGLGLFALREVPFVGRSAERDVLWSALGQVHRSGRAQAIVVRGAAGCGKTRLVEWLAIRAHEAGGAMVLCASHGVNSGPAEGLGQMISHHLRCEGLCREACFRRISDQLANLGVPQAAAHAAALTELVQPADPSRGLDPVQPVRFGSQIERYLVVELLLGHLARRRPVVVRLDDAQWGAEAIGLAEHLLSSPPASPAPILFLLTVRDDVLEGRPVEAALLRRLARLEAVRVLELGPLPPRHRSELVRSLLPLEASLVEQVAARSQGNPLFAVQLVGEWVHRGLLRAGPDGFSLQPGGELLLPDDVHDLWRSRLSQLVSSLPLTGLVAEHAIELAAALGQHVDGDEWAAACDAAAFDIPPGLLEALTARGMIRPTTSGWSFSHVMFRESVVRGAREAGRWAAHNRICGWVLREGPSRTARLGRHLSQAGGRTGALRAFREAFRQRVSAGDAAGAESMLMGWREVFASLDPPPPSDDPRRGEELVMRARLAFRSGDFERALRAADRALTRAREANWPEVICHALLCRANAHQERGYPELSLSDLGEVERVGRGLPEHLGLPLLAAAWQQRVFLLFMHGELDEALQVCRLAHQAFAEMDDQKGVATSLRLQGEIAIQSGRPGEGHAALSEALRLFSRAGCRYESAIVHNAFGDLARHQGDLVEAEQRYALALSIGRAIGAHEFAFSELNVIIVQQRRGRYPEARAALRLCQRQAERLGHRRVLAAVHLLSMPCAAAARDDRAWDTAAGLAEPLLAELGWFETDMAEGAERAACLAEEAGWAVRGRFAWGLAASQWRGLGRAAEGEAAAARALRSVTDPA